MGIVKIDGLTKIYETADGPLEAVSDMDLEIQDGEFMVLVGPSGCGKTTTLRCIAGLEDVSEGQIILDGNDITHEDPADRDMAMVFQSFALYQHMSVRENMSFGLKLAGGLSKEHIDRRVREVAEMLDIPELLDAYPDQLSGGQKQRVALGRAIIREPAVFLFDEPLSNLDAKLRTQMRSELQQLQADLSVTSIYVTHDQTEAMTMGDRITIMNAGEIQQVGTPEEVYDHPKNLFVAGFIGDPSMNFWETTIESSEEGLAVKFGDQAYRLSSELSSQLPDRHAEEITAGVRPEDVKIVRDAADTSADILTAEVQVVEPLGNENLIHLELAGAECISREDAEVRPEERTEISVTFAEKNLYLFDSDGEAIKTRSNVQVAQPADD